MSKHFNTLSEPKRENPLNQNLEPCAACAAGEAKSSSNLHYIETGKVVKGVVAEYCPVSAQKYKTLFGRSI